MLRKFPKNNYPVVLMTDFGTSGPYVASMKGVLLSVAKNAAILDLTHEIPSHNIREGAFLLLASVPFFPSGTLFVGVVDPGVGSARRLLYAEAGGWRFLAPDNGLLSWVFTRYSPTSLIALDCPGRLPARFSSTFHGRDILAPLAGRVLNGEKPSNLGAKTDCYEEIPFPEVKKIGSHWAGEILSVDKFGNLITNLVGADLREMMNHSTPWFYIGKSKRTLRQWGNHYAEVDQGRPLALEGSLGFVEISVREGKASEFYNAKAGDPVSLHFRL